ncbi:hypothetical protein C2W62_34840 [Candidatus Entotheonella serta]|nr:hypothetical protein C2W62_34840 [Candidatus Entotheonella serta]
MDKETCYYIVDGQSRLLKRLHSARLVVPARNFHHSHVAARLARSSRLAMATEVPKNTLIVRGEPNKLEEIRRYRDVHCTRSAFLDENGYELFLTDEVLVHFAHTTHDAARRELCRQFNCLVVDDTKATWRIRVVDTDEDAPLDVANALAQVPEVDFAEPNALQSATYAALAPPSDTLFQNQWHLHNTGQGGGAEGADVKALAAWDMTTGSADIRVVVHDSGVDIRHPDIQANINPGKDFDNDDDDASNNSGPHGTACAGVIAAVGNNEGVIGVAPGCRIVPLRAAGAHTWDTWAETFEWAAQHGDIISCSWSIDRYTWRIWIQFPNQRGLLQSGRCHWLRRYLVGDAVGGWCRGPHAQCQP